MRFETTKPTLSIVFVGALVGAVALAAQHVTGQEPVIGGRCEGCDAVFEGLPDEVPSRARIAPPDEPGEPMRIEGRVLQMDGTPAPGTIVYAYQTDSGGIYPRDPAMRGRPGYRHGRLRAWARADEEGRYRFDTVRPGGYPGSDVAQHVHMHVIEPGRCTYWIDSIEFTDDPRLTDAQRRDHDDARGGPGLVTPERDADGTWIVQRDIVLGRGVPGYAECGR